MQAPYGHTPDDDPQTSLTWAFPLTPAPRKDAEPSRATDAAAAFRRAATTGDASRSEGEAGSKGGPASAGR